MSERKVLNKYYPPDFDPSKIPKSKERRNATFAIRLMAPCNMRCTTCGEYIYKGRKFNARKEDVDDMTYLGLRIYRFYIKCTACVSEICFRTDPETCDYVLEAGATRNFEALKKAEDQAEMIENARQEELDNNPMKLLEERTLQSKNEMEVAESLEELRELNRRTAEVDYKAMTDTLARQSREAADNGEKEDEEFVKAVFSREAVTGSKVKRLLQESSSSGDEEPREKVAKTAPTDILVEKKVEKEKKVWEKSIGSLGGGKLGLLVKKKQPLVVKKVGNMAPPPPKTSNEMSKTVTTSIVAPVASEGNGTSSGGVQPIHKTGGSNALGLLGAYSDSDTSNSD